MNSPAQKLGIIGGGQLGRMLTEAAQKLGVEVTVIEQGPNPPAAQVGAKHIQASYDNAEALAELVNTCEVITWEIEHISTTALLLALDQVADTKQAPAVEPAIDTLETIQDKLVQKTFLANKNLPVANFVAVDSEADLKEFVSTQTKQVVLKTRKDGFDGRGNYTISDPGQVGAAWQALNPQGQQGKLLAETFVNFEREISVIAARSTNGEIVVYDPVDSVNSNNICNQVIAPSQAPAVQLDVAKTLAEQTLSVLDGAGVFAIEFFAELLAK